MKFTVYIESRHNSQHIEEAIRERILVPSLHVTLIGRECGRQEMEIDILPFEGKEVGIAFDVGYLCGELNNKV